MKEPKPIPHKTHTNWGLVQLHVSVFIMGHTTLFAKLLPFHPITIVGVRSFLAFLFLSLFQYYRKGKSGFWIFPRKEWASFLVLGLLLCFHWITYFHSIQISSVAIGMVSLFTYPVFTALLEPLVLGGKYRLVSLGIGLYVLVGTMLIAFWDNGTEGIGANQEGVLWGVVSAILYSLRNLLAKKKLSDYSGSHLMKVQLLVSFLVLTPMIEYSPELFATKNLILFLILGFVFTALAHTLYLRSLHSMPASTVGILSTISPIYGSLAAWMYLGETLDTGTILGGLIVLSGSMMETIQLNREKWIFRKTEVV